MTNRLRELEGKTDVVVISGAQKSQMLNQIPWLEDSLIYVMGQSGNDTSRTGEPLFKNLLTIQDLHSVLLHLGDLLDECLGIDYLANDTLEVRGGQVSYSFVGHNADKLTKREFDPKGDKRREMLVKVPFKNDDMIVKIGGTTCLDYTRKGWGKRGNLERLLELNGWEADDCIYVGDQLFEGGNDEDVKGLMETVQVDGPEQTLKFINSIIPNYVKG